MRRAWLCALCLGLAAPAVRALPNPLDLVQDAVGTEEREVAPGIYQLRKNGLVVEVRGVSAQTWDEIEDLLRDQISLSGGAAPSAPLADDLAYFTRQSLLQSGYPDATATWQLQPPGVVLWVREDQREWVGQIQ